MNDLEKKMTIGKAKKILRGFLAKDCYYDTPLYYAIPYLLDYITNLQEENERLKEENKHIFANVNDDQLLRSNAMNWAEAQDYKSRIEKAVEYINGTTFFGLRSGKTFMSKYLNELLNILNGKE